MELVEGERGSFEVSVGGRLVFSKMATNRFPENDEIYVHFS